MKKLGFYIIILVLYIILYTLSFVVLGNYEAFYTPEDGVLFGWETFSNMEKLAYIIYKYVLNFPLSFFNWFQDKLLYLTAYLLVPNSIVLTLLVIKRKAILAYIKKRTKK